MFFKLKRRDFSILSVSKAKEMDTLNFFSGFLGQWNWVLYQVIYVGVFLAIIFENIENDNIF